MNFKTTMVLVALLAVMAAFVFFTRDSASTYEVEQANRDADAQPGEAVFAGDEAIESDGVTHMTIERGDEKATYERANEGWRQVEPVTFAVDGFRLDDLVAAASELRTFERFEPGQGGTPQLSELQLDPPRAEVTIVANDKERIVALGRRSTGGRGYAMIGGKERVHVVGDALHKSLLTPEKLATWRRKSLQPPAATKLTRVEVTKADGGYVATKRDGRWTMGGGDERVSDVKLEEALKNLGFLSVRSFVADAPPGDAMATYGLAEPRTTITLEEPPAKEGDAPTLHTLRVGNAADLKEETVYATWSIGGPDAEPSSVVFTLPKASLDRVATTADAVRDPRIVVASNAQDVSEVEIAKQGDQTIRFRREAGAWRFAEPGPGFSLDAGSAGELVEAVLDAEASSFTAAMPSEPPAATVALSVAGREQPERVSLYVPSGESPQANWLVVREGESVGYLVQKDRLDRVMQPSIALRDRQLLELKPEDIPQVRIERPGTPAQVFTRGQQGWNLEGAAAFERGELDRLVQTLGRLRAESWSTAGMSESVTAGPTVTLVMPSGQHTLRVLDVEARRAALDGIAEPFTLPATTVDLMNAEFRDRTAITLTAEQIASVVLAAGETRATLRRGEGGAYVIEGVESVDQARAAGVFDTLAGLRVQRWLDTPRRDKSARGMVSVEVTPTTGEPIRLTLFTTDAAGILGEGAGARHFQASAADVSKIVAPVVPEEALKADAAEMDDGEMVK